MSKGKLRYNHNGKVDVHKKNSIIFGSIILANFFCFTNKERGFGLHSVMGRTHNQAIGSIFSD